MILKKSNTVVKIIYFLLPINVKSCSIRNSDKKKKKNPFWKEAVTDVPEERQGISSALLLWRRRSLRASLKLTRRAFREPAASGGGWGGGGFLSFKVVKV